MTRLPGHVTSEGQSWFAEPARAARSRTPSVAATSSFPRPLAHGVGVRGVAKALRVDKSTVSRRYGQRARDTPA
jgi:hypothetical protein